MEDYCWNGTTLISFDFDMRVAWNHIEDEKKKKTLFAGLSVTNFPNEIADLKSNRSIYIEHMWREWYWSMKGYVSNDCKKLISHFDFPDN